MNKSIWHIVETLDTGGAERMVADLARAQARFRPVTICCLKHKGPVALSLAGDPVRVIELGKGEGNDFRLPFRLASLLRKGNVGIVHSHDWGAYCETAVAAYLAGINAFYHTAHGDFHPSGNNWSGKAKWRVRRRVEKVLSVLVDRLVAVSSELKDRIHNETGIPEHKIRVIRNGARLRNPDKVHMNGLRHSLGLPKEAFVIITVSRLAPVKNLGVLIDSFRRVREVRMEARLLVVGDGPDGSALRETAARLGVAEYVSFLGEREDVSECLGISNLYVNSSIHEGISIAILEALLARLPVIATAVGGNLELIENGRTGIHVPPADLKRLADEIIKLIDDEQKRSRLAEAGHMKAVREFSFEGMVEAYESLYRI